MSRSSGASETSCGTKDKSYSGAVCSFSVPVCQGESQLGSSQLADRARPPADPAPSLSERRRAAARKAAATRKRQAEARRFLADGTPIGPRPSRGTARGDYSPGELIAAIRGTLDRMRAAEEARS